MAQTKKLRPGFARIQFIAIAKSAEELMAMGHTIKSAYEELKKENKITMTYDSFRRHLKSKRKECDSQCKENVALQNSSTNESVPKIISNKSSAFSPKISLDEYSAL